MKMKAPKNNGKLRGKYLMKCHCGNEYEAKGSDLGRGWGFSCSRSCSAHRRESGIDGAEIISQTHEIKTARSQMSTRKETEIILVDAETGEVIGRE